MATTATTNASVLPLCCTREDTPCACCQRWMAYIESRERELQQQHHQQLHSHTAVWPPHVDFGDALDIECCPLESLDAVTRSGDPSMDHRHVGVTSVVSAPSSHSHDDTCMTDGHHSHSHHGHGHGHGHDHGTSSSITCDSPPASCQWPPMGASFLDLCPTTPALSLCVSTACVPTLNLSQQLLAQQNGGNVSSGSSGEVGTFSGTSSGLANALQQAAAQTSTSSGNVNSSNMTDQQQQQQQVLFHHHHHGGLPASAAHVHCTEEQALMATGNDAQRAAHIHTKACNPQVHYQFSTNNVIHDHTMPLLGVSSPVKEEDGSSASSSGLTSVSNSTIASGLMSNGLKFDPSLYPTKASVVVAGTQSSTTTSTPFLPCSRVHTFPAPFRFHPYGVGPPVPSRATLSAVHHQTSSNEEEKNKNSSNGNNTNMLNTSAASGVTPLQASSSLSTSTTSTMTSALSSNSNVSTPTNSKNGFHTPSSNAPSVSASSAASAVVASIGAISNGVGMSSIPSSSTSMSTASSSSMNAGIGGSIGGVGGLNFASSSTPVSNCHQCKVKKYSATVIQCTAVHEVTVRRSKPMCCVQKKKCAKKYCTTCLAKHYGVQIEQLNRANWVCPGCLGHCTCAACTNKSRSSSLGLGPVGTVGIVGLNGGSGGVGMGVPHAGGAAMSGHHHHHHGVWAGLDLQSLQEMQTTHTHHQHVTPIGINTHRTTYGYRGAGVPQQHPQQHQQPVQATTVSTNLTPIPAKPIASVATPNELPPVVVDATQKLSIQDPQYNR